VFFVVALGNLGRLRLVKKWYTNHANQGRARPSDDQTMLTVILIKAAIVIILVMVLLALALFSMGKDEDDCDRDRFD